MADSRIPVLLELKKNLEEELEDLRHRIQQIEGFIEALTAIIISKSFATADASLSETDPTESVPTKPERTTIPESRSVMLYDYSRKLVLATLDITKNEIRAIPSERASYDIKKGAFARFFVERILGKFQKEDRTKVEEGSLTWEDAFDFEVKAEDGILEEIVIRNYRSEARLKEIERSLRWSLEKTYSAK